jgi:putative FmdB family regulatory protein
MPFYEYECQSCKFYTELMQKISDPPLEKCPSCGKKTMQKLISAPVFRLKGSGWYETDFKGENENKRNLAGADKEESKSDESSGPKTDSKSSDAKKPDAKEDSKPKAPAEDKPVVAVKTAARASSGGSAGKSAAPAAPSRSGSASKGGSSSSKAKPTVATASRRGGGRTVSKPKAKAKGKSAKGRR